MGDAFEIRLNGRLLRVEDESPNTPLLDYLRKHGLTGAKEGCAEGDCGACSVAIVERDAQGHPTYRAINSCLVPMFEGYYRDDIRTQDQLDDQLCGNLCRCTGYRPIRDAAIEAFAERHKKNGHDAFAERLKQPLVDLGEVEYNCDEEKFFRPTSLLELLHLRQKFPGARLMAGATELGLDIT